jgi:predicted enzyme related to lactoylglutathione lyase
MPRVIHFEIGTDDPERASQFYAMVFGWKTVKWAGPIDYWLITTGPETEPGIDGAIMRRAAPNMATVNTIGVESVSEYQDLVIAHGGKVIMPREVVPGVGYFAYCQDTEGNTFGIMENNPSAS